MMRVAAAVSVLCVFLATGVLGAATAAAEMASAVALGGSHVCALSEAGGVWCWGANSYGQVGDGSKTMRTAPVAVSGLDSGVTAIAVGSQHGCALTTAGGVLCWGRGGWGQLGNGDLADRWTPAAVSGLASGVVAIAAGGEHTCALTAAVLLCWGRNSDGQLGDGSTSHRLTPVAVSGLPAGVTAISLGANHSCAVTATGGVRCWGRNADGQLGDASTTSRAAPVAVSGLASGVTAVDAGSYHTCARTMAGAVLCWGRNADRQLGDGTTTARRTPVAVSGLAAGVTAISAGGNHSCARLGGGGIRCWGSNAWGQLGDGTTSIRTTPVEVAGLTRVATRVAAGGSLTCAVISDGGLRCWGTNYDSGQLGVGSIFQSAVPLPMPGLEAGALALAAGWMHSCAITPAGGAVCWGDNGDGQLGYGSNLMGSHSPVPVAGLGSGVTAIAAGWSHSCAVANGGVVCWGGNAYGQLGDGSGASQPTPVPVPGLGSGAVGIAAGNEHTCALTAGGAVRCWGSNRAGQLGDGDPYGPSIRWTPVDVSGLASGVAQISAGGSYSGPEFGQSCALTNAGGILCWGEVLAYVPECMGVCRTPAAMPGLASAIAGVTVGGLHACALTTGGGILCLGENSSGQLGDGSGVAWSGAPVPVSGAGSGFAMVATGSWASHTCALTSTGAVRCWGYNQYGQLGDGSLIDRTTPVPVTGLDPGMTVLSVGVGYTCAGGSGVPVHCWGSNEAGQLGQRLTYSSNVPIAVVGFEGGPSALPGPGLSALVLLATALLGTGAVAARLRRGGLQA